MTAYIVGDVYNLRLDLNDRMIRLKNAEKHYRQFDLNCSLEVKPGQITGLIGENGAGKSTTFKLILDLIHADGGKIKVFGKPAHEANLLVLDEPTAGLDVIVRDEFLEMLQDYMSKGERSILISSHISSDLENLCDDFYMIHDGQIIMHEDTDVLLSEYGILKPTMEQYQNLDKQYLLKVKKETFGYRCLTNERQYYVENFPDVIIEKGNIDEMILLMVRGEEA